MNDEVHLHETPESILVPVSLTDHPWEQQPGESDAQYVRFLSFRNLGPSRTVALALEVSTLPVRQVRTRKANAKSKSGKSSITNWYADSSQWNWVERAQQWDLHNLREAGDLVQAAIVDFMLKLLQIGVEALLRCKRPTTWQDALSLFESLAKYVPQAPNGVPTDL